MASPTASAYGGYCVENLGPAVAVSKGSVECGAGALVKTVFGPDLDQVGNLCPIAGTGRAQLIGGSASAWAALASLILKRGRKTSERCGRGRPHRDQMPPVFRR